MCVELYLRFPTRLHDLHRDTYTLDTGLLARSQYSEGPATGHLDTGFLGFPVSISKC